jgi:hypothetical protein
VEGPVCGLEIVIERPGSQGARRLQLAAYSFSLMQHAMRMVIFLTLLSPKDDVKCGIKR